jgi:hypothetical protein
MSMSTTPKLPRAAVALMGVAALALPAAAAAKGGHGHGHAPKQDRQSQAGHGGKHAPHSVQYIFRGTWNAGAVDVTSGNNHVRRAGLVGQSLTFDLTNARIRVADVNGDGSRDAADLQDGDRVLVQARLPKGDPGTGPYAARKLVDKGAPSTSDDPAGSEDPAGSGTDDTQPEQD